MPDIERFLKDKLKPVYQAHYAVWVHWWPLWRGIFSGRNIRRKWQRYNLVEEGQTFLDYGCGTGSFTIPAARIIGVRGKVYALDCFPRQLAIVAGQSKKKGLINIETMLSDGEIALSDECVDLIWMCDVLHEVKERQAVLKEMHRVLRKGGILAIYDGMREEILNYTGGLFSLTERDDKFFKFAKIC